MCPTGIQYSQRRVADIYSASMEAGASASLSAISSEQSFLPRALQLGIKAELFGHVYNIFELWTRAQGVQALLADALLDKHLAHKIGAAVNADRSEYSLSSILKETAKVIERLAARSSKSRKTAQTQGEAAESFESSAALRIFGYDVAHWMLDAAQIKVLTQATSLSNSDFASIVTSLLSNEGLTVNIEKSYVVTGAFLVPTMAGIPIAVNTTMFAQADITGAVKLAIPSSAASKSAGSISIPSFTASVAIKPHIAVHGHVLLGTYIGPIKAHTAIHAAAVVMAANSVSGSNAIPSSSEGKETDGEFYSAKISYDATRMKSEISFGLPSNANVHLVANATIVPVNAFAVIPESSSGMHAFDIKEVKNNFTATKNASIFKFKVSLMLFHDLLHIFDEVI